MSRAIVVGAGVIGLSCAARLLEAGHRVDVVARELPLETTSAIAAAIWYPYLAYPRERVEAWGLTTLAVFEQLADDPSTGVVRRHGIELLSERAPRPEWAATVPSFAVAAAVPEPYVGGWNVQVPVIEMPIYLGWLTARVRDLGGTITRMALSHLPRPAGVTVVNCSGLGALGLAQDRSVGPIAGQVVVIEQVGLEHWWMDDASVSYAIPRSETIVLGGSADQDNWSRVPDPAVARAIIARCAAMVPEFGSRLERARIVAHRVGLRPGRPTVRLEEERIGDSRVVHCYGHGGSGVTLSWGCAGDVVDLVGPA
ncbi:MAG: FAD-dependent oxidoreductase [Micrococcales bacterium]|nr:FAD-dependent oxidoreductase [Micrococcales bacterium]